MPPPDQCQPGKSLLNQRAWGDYKWEANVYYIEGKHYIEGKAWWQRTNIWFGPSLHLFKIYVCIILCNCHDQYNDVASLWFHENETDPGVFLQTHLSTCDMFIPNTVFAYKAMETSNHFSLNHFQSHVLAKCKFKQECPPQAVKMFNNLVPSWWCSLGWFGRCGIAGGSTSLRARLWELKASFFSQLCLSSLYCGSRCEPSASFPSCYTYHYVCHLSSVGLALCQLDTSYYLWRFVTEMNPSISMVHLRWSKKPTYLYMIIHNSTKITIMK